LKFVCDIIYSINVTEMYLIRIDYFLLSHFLNVNVNFLLKITRNLINFSAACAVILESKHLQKVFDLV